ncbi:hypothetical protein I204_03048 [Kwoniella mangroviensis CBS 8886]|uniref:uncharacterized protein n=1 Tax=Kwoniella mangroviensis CBS 8507 TaxID=1296122 RepID=UPI00080CC63C|nr:hypothetical protein I204_03048 [Kwoniella mangroviensis CBS 8886]
MLDDFCFNQDTYLHDPAYLDDPVDTQSVIGLTVIPSTFSSGPFEVSAPTPNEIAALRQELQDAHSTIERMTAALLLLGMPPEDIVQLTTNFEDTVSPK